MAKYSYAQLEGLWTQNGGSAALAPIMAAIAMAESSGVSTETNPNDNGGRQTSWGLWQLSDGTHNQPVSNILDPNVNAAQAVKKYKSQGLKAWGTYTSGAYKKFLQQGVAASTSGITGSSSTAQQAGAISDIGGAIGTGLADAIASIFKPFINILIWGTETLLGAGLIVAGVLIMVSNSSAGKKIESQVGQDAVAIAAPEAEPELAAEKQLAHKTVAKKLSPPNKGV
jgi:hypothetical protein